MGLTGGITSLGDSYFLEEVVFLLSVGAPPPSSWWQQTSMCWGDPGVAPTDLTPGGSCVTHPITELISGPLPCPRSREAACALWFGMNDVSSRLTSRPCACLPDA